MTSYAIVTGLFVAGLWRWNACDRAAATALIAGAIAWAWFAAP